MDSRNAGQRRNGKLEARPDVLTFTSPPLGEPLEVIGPVSASLHVRGSGRACRDEPSQLVAVTLVR